MESKPTYVTFEQAKLLKEKGFNIECNHYYEHALTSLVDQQDGYSGPFGWEKGELNYQSGYFINNIESVDTSNESWYLCARPEQWQVVEWLRVNYGIWVEVTPDSYGEEWFVTCKPCSKKVWDDIELRSKVHLSKLHFLFYKTPQEAHSTAFDYILKELI